MAQTELIEILVERLSEFTIHNFKKIAEEYKEPIVKELTERRESCLTVADEIKILKDKFYELELELVKISELSPLFSFYTKDIIKNYYNKELAQPKYDSFLKGLLEQLNKKTLAQLKIEFSIIITEDIIPDIIFRDRKTGKNYSIVELAKIENIESKKFQKEIAQKYSAYTYSDKYSVDTSTILAFVSDEFATNVIIPENDFLEIHASNKLPPFSRIFALQSVMKLIKSELNKIGAVQIEGVNVIKTNNNLKNKTADNRNKRPSIKMTWNGKPKILNDIFLWLSKEYIYKGEPILKAKESQIDLLLSKHIIYKDMQQDKGEDDTPEKVITRLHWRGNLNALVDIFIQLRKKKVGEHKLLQVSDDVLFNFIYWNFSGESSKVFNKDTLSRYFSPKGDKLLLKSSPHKINLEDFFTTHPL